MKKLSSLALALTSSILPVMGPVKKMDSLFWAVYLRDESRK